MTELHERPFSLYSPIVKATESEDKRHWIVEGPLTEPSADLQDDEMVAGKGLEKGLQVLDAFGGQVDWNHLYERTQRAKFLIGKGVSRYMAPHPVTGVPVPWMKAEIFNDPRKPVGREAIEHLECGGGLGFSLFGRVLTGGRDGNRVLRPIFTSVALTPNPVVSLNSGTVRMLAKALNAAEALSDEALDELEFPLVGELLEILPFAKALVPDGTLPRTGPGPNALGMEDLTGSRGRTTANSRGKRDTKRRLMRQVARRLAALRAGCA